MDIIGTLTSSFYGLTLLAYLKAVGAALLVAFKLDYDIWKSSKDAEGNPLPFDWKKARARYLDAVIVVTYAYLGAVLGPEAFQLLNAS